MCYSVGAVYKTTKIFSTFGKAILDVNQVLYLQAQLNHTLPNFRFKTHMNHIFLLQVTSFKIKVKTAGELWFVQILYILFSINLCPILTGHSGLQNCKLKPSRLSYTFMTIFSHSLSLAYGHAAFNYCRGFDTSGIHINFTVRLRCGPC